MEATAMEKSIYGKDVTVLKRDACCCMYKLSDPSGEALMTRYHVFPGIDLIYNDVHMQTCFVDIYPPEGMIEIDHCKEGRIECEFRNGEYMYIETGDLSVRIKNNLCIGSYFPLSHYHGVTIAIDLNQASETLSCVLDDIKIDLLALASKLTTNNGYVIMRAKDAVELIFSELYTIPDDIKLGYFKIKVLELLLFLSIPGTIEQPEPRRYYSRTRVEKIKAMKAYLIEHADRHYTLNELSAIFNIPLTSMKNCFKGVYGCSVYTFIRTYRIQKAALLLKETDHSVLSIAGKVGYDNGSKFASAFKEIMNASPKEYRNALVQTERFLSVRSGK